VLGRGVSEICRRHVHYSAALGAEADS
jgi:hypothetical protein